MNSILESTILLTQKLKTTTFEIGYTNGYLNLLEEDIESIVLLSQKDLIEVFIQDNTSIESEDLENYISQDVKLQIKTGDISNYFDTKEKFVNGNKFECKHQDFYIVEINYRENTEIHPFISGYKKHLELVDFLRCIADNEKKKGSNLDLFFYKSGKGTDLIIDYNFRHLEELEINFNGDIKEQLLDPITGEDKKQLFINELVAFTEKHGNSYANLMENWGILMLNYQKSYSLFLSGFSFEKIKTSSTEHFQKLVDKISESIGKASTYIFGVPVGYILLLNGFDFTGLQIGKNLVLLLLGAIFLILIWRVLFKNISETIQIIEIEIEDFIKKVETVIVLSEIKEKLEGLKMKDLKAQRKKLRLVKVLSALIFIIICMVYLYTFLDISIFYL